MGFGTLFIGYFLLLNIAYFSFTDLIMGLLLLLACYRLLSVNQYFKSAALTLIPFSALALFELIQEIITMFSPNLANETLTGILGMIRYIFIACFTFLILMGIETVANEVELPKLTDKARKVKVLSLLTFAFCTLLEIPGLDSIIDTKALSVIALILLILSFAVTVVALTAIYSAYMYICMPNEVIKKDKLSRFGFVNKFREYESRKQREYAEYRLDSMKKKNQKKKGKK